MEFGVLGFVVAGLLVGFIVGMTGVGGGSLMTPILLWFGINPAAWWAPRSPTRCP
jgi:uncharacterized membrane protein YfcA